MMSLSKYKVAVLGAGPSGLLAAEGVRMCGITPDIYSIKRKSPTGGAMYLHQPIFGLTGAGANIQIRKIGTAERYALKVYGTPDMTSQTSFVNGYDGERVPAWDLVEAYDHLWDRWEGEIRHGEIAPWNLQTILDRYDLVLCSLPADKLCIKGKLHQFPSAPIWIANENLAHLPDQTILYNGAEESWYRASVIFGRPSVEWGRVTTRPPLKDMQRVNKPVATNCDCWLDQSKFVRVGRFGRWDKWTLSHHAFSRANAAVEQLVAGGHVAL